MWGSVLQARVAHLLALKQLYRYKPPEGNRWRLIDATSLGSPLPMHLLAICLSVCRQRDARPSSMLCHRQAPDAAKQPTTAVRRDRNVERDVVRPRTCARNLQSRHGHGSVPRSVQSGIVRCFSVSIRAQGRIVAFLDLIRETLGTTALEPGPNLARGPGHCCKPPFLDTCPANVCFGNEEVARNAPGDG